MKKFEEINDALRGICKRIAAESEGINENTGVLVILGKSEPEAHNMGGGFVFGGGRTEPIVSGLVHEMKRSPGLYKAVRMALTIVDEEKAQQN